MGYTKFDANTNGGSATNAAFQQWGSWISTAIANCGIVKVTGVGEVDWSTQAKPADASTFPAYEVWRFNDSLQSAAPVFFKLEYGSSSFGNTVMAIALTVGSGSNGVGGLTGVCTERRVWQCGFTFANSTQVSYACGDTGRFVMAYNANGVGSNSVGGAGTTQCHFKLGLERTLDGNGSPTTDGLLITGGAYLKWEQIVWHPKIGPMTNWDPTWGILTPVANLGASGGNYPVYPLFYSAGGPFLNPGYNWIAYLNPDFTANTTTTMTYYGSTHTFMPLGLAAVNNLGTRAGGNCCAMIRWE